MTNRSCSSSFFSPFSSPPLPPLLILTSFSSSSSFSAEEGVATLAIFSKYLVIQALGVGVAPLLRDSIMGVRGGGETKVATT